MKKTMNFNKKLLATLVATSSLAGFNAVADDEEVVVTGIRGSLQRSMDLKKESTGIVDAISAEDMGKFPDTNLAESMQRITGVSIDRSGGEGSKITVRGVGPDSNLVTFNGRTVARATGDRSFDFANLASELVSNVTVTKSANAMTDSGGMGATINVNSARPLAHPGQKAVVSAKGMKDESSLASDNLTPELFGLYSNTFADDTIGVQVALGYQRRNSGERVATVEDGWHSKANSDTSSWGAIPATGQTSRPATTAAGIYLVPQSMRYTFNESERRRTNGQLVLQWKPADAVTLTLDVDTYRRQVGTLKNDLSAWYTFSQQHAVWSPGPISTPLLYTETYGLNSVAVVGTGTAQNPQFPSAPLPYTLANATQATGAQDYAMASRMQATKETGTTTGFNVAWEVSDNLSLNLDMSNSVAKLIPNSGVASSADLQAAAFIRTSNSADFSGTIPAMIVGNGNAVKPSDMMIVGHWFQNVENNSNVAEQKITGNYKFSDDMSLDFGAQRIDLNAHNRFTAVQVDDWGGAHRLDNSVTAPGELTAVYTGTETTILDKFNGNFGDFSKASSLPGGATLADGTNLSKANLLNKFFAPNFWDLWSASNARYNNPTQINARNAAGQTVGDCGGTVSIFCASHQWDKGTDITVNEQTNSLFGQFNWTAGAFDTHVGVRYESTKVESSGTSPTYTAASWDADTEVHLTAGPVTYTHQTGKYSYVLPSVTETFSVTDDIKIRAALSKSISRANYGDLQGGFNVNSGANQSGGTGSTGNPGLKPTVSKNFDLSAEWYFNDNSYASVGYYKKKVSNFITRTPIDWNLFGLRNPTRGTYYNQAVAATGSTDAGIIRTWIGNNLVGQPGVTADASGLPGRVHVAGVASVNPLMNFQITTPVNGTQERDLHGFEGAVQYVFGESGFGAAANFTSVVSDLTYDDVLLTDQEAMIGLSNSYNLVGFYEDHGVSVRLAYNYRAQFLSNRSNARGNASTYTEPYGQLDLNTSYEVNDNMQVFLQAINLSNRGLRQHVRNSNAPINYTETGTRWIVGTTYKF